jgi:hypothetical protein
MGETVKKFKDLTWEEICRIRDSFIKMDSGFDERNKPVRHLVFGFYSFVGANWINKNKTYKWAFEFFNEKYLEMDVYLN